MKVIEGDLLELGASGSFDVIIHGCNCQNDMGAGIAKAIKARFPEAYEADQATEKGSRDKLGTTTFAKIACEGHELIVVNAYTQFHWRGSGVLVDYDAIRTAFRETKDNFTGKRIAYPLLGAGLGGGDWEIISKIIDEELEGEDHTLVKFAG